ncbi:MAG: alpha-L-arabinofuranosidase, partial [Prevotella sp.]|nr:alpha-L-arabinofuranosidase [Prevotella sp.]
TRYDNYDRKGPKVFAGEYACHVSQPALPVPEGKNVFEGALYEAALMTGIERNADVVHMATYAPLFAHEEGWQWRPDLIWMDNLATVRTPNYYVQQLYAQNVGTNVLSLTEDKKAVTGQDGLCASAVYDKNTKKYIVKMVNIGNHPQDVQITFKGLKTLPKDIQMTVFHSNDPMACNTVERPDVIRPVEQAAINLSIEKNTARFTVPARTFAVYKF